MNEEQREYSCLFAGVRYSLLRDEAPVCDSSDFTHCRIYSSLVSCVLTLSTSSSLGSDAETCIKYKGNDITL